MTTTKSKRINSAIKSSSKSTQPLTSHIEIVGMGESKHRHQFVKLSIKGRKKAVLVRFDNLASNKATVFEGLNKHRAHLVSAAAQTELIKRIQDYGPRTPSFTVAEEIGLFGDCFILPDRSIPVLPNGVEVYLSDIPAEFISKYKCAGTREGWLELGRYAIGNTRMMFAFALRRPSCRYLASSVCHGSIYSRRWLGKEHDCRY